MDGILSTLGSVGINAATAGVNYMLAEKHADKAMNRQKELMQMQQDYNQANAKNAYSNQVQGMRLAGLNPAMAQAQAAPVQSVSQGNAPKGENVELDPNNMLVMAQIKNLEAQTDKTEAESKKISGVDTENVEANTAKMIAETINEGYKGENIQADTGLKGKQSNKVEAETQNIRNTNFVFEEENKGVALFGQTVAMDWQKQDWYKSLPSGTKKVIDSIASGEVDLSIGSLRALDTAIASDKSMNAMERAKAEDAMARAVVQAQMKDPKVMKALAKMPESQRNNLVAHTAKLITENNVMKFDFDWNKQRKNIWEKQDVDKLYNDFIENPDAQHFGVWFLTSFMDKVKRVGESALPTYTAGRGFSYGQRVEKEAAQQAERKQRSKAAERLWEAVQKDPRFNGMPKPDVQGNDSYWKY